MTVSGRRIIVTGASSGLGAHTVRALAGEGAHVLAVARREDRLELLARELAAAPGRVEPFRADVTTEDGCAGLVEAATAALGGIVVDTYDGAAASRSGRASARAGHAVMEPPPARCPQPARRAPHTPPAHWVGSATR